MTFSLPSVEWGAILCVASEQEIDEAAVRDYLRSTHGAHAIPKEFFAPTALPVTALGKPDRHKLRATYEKARA